MKNFNPGQFLSPAFYAAAVVGILTLTGVFAQFEGRDVIIDTLALNTVILFIMLFGAAYATAWRNRNQGVLMIAVAGLAGSLISALVLAFIVVLNLELNLRNIFVNLGTLNPSKITFDETVSLSGLGDAESTELGGLLRLMLYALMYGAAAAALVIVPAWMQSMSKGATSGLMRLVGHIGAHIRMALLVAALLVVVMGLVAIQINEIMTLPDALVLIGIFLLGLLSSWLLSRFMGLGLLPRLAVGAVLGLIVGAVLMTFVQNGALRPERVLRDPALPTTTSESIVIRRAPPALVRFQSVGALRGTGDKPIILEMAEEGKDLPFMVAMGAAGLVGALSIAGTGVMSGGVATFMVSLLALGILNAQEEMTLRSAQLIFLAFFLLVLLAPVGGAQARKHFERGSEIDQRTVRLLFTMLSLGVLVILPEFVNLYVANVFNWIALYVIMGMGLNVMIGYTGLLDLGYVASFAIGAYTLGLLTAPNILTCGGVNPADIPFDQLNEACTGTMTFWQAWPFCVAISAITGMALGVPVLGLRGDYLAIVTLGFGEITNRIVKSNATKDLLGGAQGISPIPTPTIDLTSINESWLFNMGNSSSIFYLYLFSVILTAFVVYRLSRSRLGRAWRAIRADEDVAEAMGIHLVKYKLLAFGVSSAFAGLGGAVFGAQLQGIFPDSFTILVSINVLSLIIMGGMGSLWGVVLGAMILVGLPELLRELGAYRLLGYGVLLVLVMLTKPEGLLPPSPSALSEKSDREDKDPTTASSRVLSMMRGGGD